MILMTGATGTLGRPLLQRLLGAGEQVRCLVREPRRLGPSRVQVQISLGNLADTTGLDRTLRGVDTVIHLAATTRDQPRGTIEELNGLATLRLLNAAKRAGARRFVYVSSFNASQSSASRFIRMQALAAEAVKQSTLEAVIFEAGIIYAPDDPWIKLMSELARLPVMPVIGRGRAAFQPIWAEDAADAITATLLKDIATPGAPIALAGPDRLNQNQILKIVMRHFGAQKPLLHLPTGPARKMLDWQEQRFGQATLATWDQVALLQDSILSPRGTGDLSVLGVEPLPMADVLPAR
ncbi:MAG: NAD(P)H-binding protein [Thermoleophilaceae bacterium]|nr:NAD(P)H-binding protein [Thermoleophilaceae bacterium]